MTTAFVLSGGGSLGSVQVGMLLALAERGIEPDLLIGASVGAINAAWMAGSPGLDGARQLAHLWCSVRRREVFPTRPLVGLVGFLGRRDHLVPSSKLRSLLRQNLRYENLEDASTPVQVVATEVISGTEVVLTRGSVVEAVLASAALPGVFPPVRLQGQDLMDGGVVNNTPISLAIAAGASTIYVLPSGYACALPHPPGSALGMVLQALTLLIQERFIVDIARYENLATLRVAPPLCPLDVSPVDFSQAAELIERSHASTGQWLDTATTAEDPSRFMGFHHHGSR